MNLMDQLFDRQPQAAPLKLRLDPFYSSSKCTSLKTEHAFISSVEYYKNGVKDNMDYVYSPDCIECAWYGVRGVKKDEYFVEQVDLAQLHTIKVWPRKVAGEIRHDFVEFLDNQANTLLFRGNPAEKLHGLPSKDFTLQQG